MCHRKLYGLHGICVLQNITAGNLPPPRCFSGEGETTAGTASRQAGALQPLSANAPSQEFSPLLSGLSNT